MSTAEQYNGRERASALSRRLPPTEYWSESSQQWIAIRWMPIPHAKHALAKLDPKSALAEALRRRIAQDGQLTDVDTIDGTGRLLRSDHGRFSGAIRVTPKR